MPNTHTTLSSLFSDIANAIRAKTGSQSQIVADNFPSEIANIPTGVDTSDATATDGDILSGKTAYLADGTKHTGSMTDRGSVDVTLDTTTTSYTVPSGKHSGSGTVKVVTQTKSATPSGSAQTISADSGKVLSSVSVGAVTKNSGIGQTLYNQGVSDTKVGTASASDVLSGKTFTNASSVGASGSMTNRGAWTTSVTPSGSAQTVTIPSGYHNGSGYVSVGASSGVEVEKFTAISKNTLLTNITVSSSSPFDLKNYVENGKFYLVTTTSNMATDISGFYFEEGIIAFRANSSTMTPPSVKINGGIDLVTPSLGVGNKGWLIFVIDKNKAKLKYTSSTPHTQTALYSMPTT